MSTSVFGLCITTNILIDTFVIAFLYSKRATVRSLDQIIISWIKHVKLLMSPPMRNLLRPQFSRNLLRPNRILNSLQRTCNNSKCWHSSNRWSSSKDSSLWPSSKLWPRLRLKHKLKLRLRLKHKHRHKLRPRCKLRDKDIPKPIFKHTHQVFLSPTASIPPCQMVNKCFHHPMVWRSNSNFRHMQLQDLGRRWRMRAQMPMVVFTYCSNSNSMRKHLSNEQRDGCRWVYRKRVIALRVVLWPVILPAPHTSVIVGIRPSQSHITAFQTHYISA